MDLMNGDCVALPPAGDAGSTNQQFFRARIGLDHHFLIGRFVKSLDDNITGVEKVFDIPGIDFVIDGGYFYIRIDRSKILR